MEGTLTGHGGGVGHRRGACVNVVQHKKKRGGVGRRVGAPAWLCCCSGCVGGRVDDEIDGQATDNRTGGWMVVSHRQRQRVKKNRAGRI